MFSTVTKENINTMKTKNKKLSKEYQKYTNNYIIDLESQRSNIDIEEEKIKNLYTDDSTTFKENITINDIEAIRLSLNTLPQEDVKKNGNEVLDNAIKIVKEREAEREAERRRQAIEAERRRQEQIKNA